MFIPRNVYKIHFVIEAELRSLTEGVRDLKKKVFQKDIPVFEGEYWTSKQRQGHSLHEVSYRACFKPQLPAYFIERLTRPGGRVYDPFGGRGTTALEAALRGRYVSSNDINPLSRVLLEARLNPPTFEEIKKRLETINFKKASCSTDVDLSMFYEKKTLVEILSLRDYLCSRKKSSKEDSVDRWIRMVATNRLTGHSSGFFSVYTLPPNQAVTAKRQILINQKLNQKPSYRDVKEIILKKSKQLLSRLSSEERFLLKKNAEEIQIISGDARNAFPIQDESIDLVVTSPPFLDVVDYASDNWLRCWFNSIALSDGSSAETNFKNPNDWKSFIHLVFVDLYRVLKKNAFVAFEVGEVRSGKVLLEELVVEAALPVGFKPIGLFVNRQDFTKTANIWGISNNEKGTNSNRIVVLKRL